MAIIKGDCDGTYNCLAILKLFSISMNFVLFQVEEVQCTYCVDKIRYGSIGKI